MAERDFLLEIGCEEIPAGEITAALDALPAFVAARLAEARLPHGALRVWGTPRRLAVGVSGLAEAQATLEETLQGPPEKAAFGADGAPTQAAIKFAEKAGVPVTALTVEPGAKGRYVTARRRIEGRPAAELLPGIAQAVIAGLAWRKSMRWGSHTEKFVRPVQWLLCRFGADVVPFAFAGVVSGGRTRGHRFVANAWVDVPTLAAYEAVLTDVSVMPDPAERRTVIQAQIQALEAQAGAKIVPDDGLLHEVANLLEWPTAVCGTFDERFLEVPREVIVSAMRGHQRYFAMERPDGSLANRFVTVLGTPVRDLDVAVRGNERVLAARLSDARFFWTEDRKVPLDRRAEALKDVVFQAKLGTIHEKSERLVALCGQLAPAFEADPALARRAATLAKADLVTQMVGEFPDLQGVMGRYYALAQGEPAAVADAILEHYQPRGAADGLPAGAVGATVAAMDRLDTLVGCLGAGLKPRGGGDPFGLRRAALGLLRILLDRDLSVSLSAWVAAAAALHTRVTPDRAEVLAFVLERLRGLLGEAHPGEIVSAVMAAGGDDPVDLLERAAALAAFAQGPEYAALATTFRRMNILKQGTAIPTEIPVAGLVEPPDLALLKAFQATAAKVEGLCERRDYAAALLELAALRPPVDAFFTDVKVMADDPAVREARLALLAAVDRLFRRVADFKLIAG